jgi:hypothetical protein
LAEGVERLRAHRGMDNLSPLNLAPARFRLIDLEAGLPAAETLEPRAELFLLAERPTPILTAPEAFQWDESIRTSEVRLILFAPKLMPGKGDQRASHRST